MTEEPVKVVAITGQGLFVPAVLCRRIHWCVIRFLPWMPGIGVFGSQVRVWFDVSVFRIVKRRAALGQR